MSDAQDLSDGESGARWLCEVARRARPRPPGALTTCEAAAALGLTSHGVRAAIRRGALEATLLSRRRAVVTLEAVEQYRREHLDGQGWDKRKQPGYTPDRERARRARNMRAYRRRRRIATCSLEQQDAPGSPPALST